MEHSLVWIFLFPYTLPITIISFLPQKSNFSSWSMRTHPSWQPPDWLHRMPPAAWFSVSSEDHNLCCLVYPWESVLWRDCVWLCDYKPFSPWRLIWGSWIHLCFQGLPVTSFPSHQLVVPPPPKPFLSSSVIITSPVSTLSLPFLGGRSTVKAQPQEISHSRLKLANNSIRWPLDLQWQLTTLIFLFLFLSLYLGYQNL